MSNTKCRATLIVLSVVAFTPHAIAGDRTEADFTRACAASSNLSAATCECSAAKARAELTPDGFSFLVATLEGNEAAAAKLRGKLPIDQVMKAGTFMTRGPAACASEAATPE
jgi:hypothetical protein